ncbi:MAG: peptidase M16 [Gammaproteobacteria bacterium]|nr:peptidase M16 [Gammaproteobacteria bacterium]|tara:strand:+ start:1000 stop:3729 length:2730 start_codon:yes stop_codon:yes gene_type:complete
MKHRISLLSFIFFSSIALSITIEDLPKIEYEKFTLDNGLTIIVHEDKKVPMVAVNVWYHVGSKNEKLGKSGFAHLFEHLMFNGTENYNNEYFEPFEKIGATSQNGTTNSDRTNYFQNVPTNALDLALWMESERMGHILGVIDKEKLDEQRGVVQNEKRLGENRPYGKARERLSQATYPKGHPYSWTVIGSMEDLNAASLDDVQEWFKSYYGPNNAVLVLAGDIDLETAKEKVNKYFGDIPSGPSFVKPRTWIAKRNEDTRDTMEDDVSQSLIYMIWNVPELGTYEASALELAAGTLSGGKNSPLYKELVYNQQIATSAYSYYYGREIAGQFIISIQVAKDQDPEFVENEAMKVINKFLKTGPDKKLLANEKTETYADAIFGLQRIGGFGGKADILASYETYFGDPDFYFKEAKDYLEMTAMEVKNISNEWLSSGRYVLTINPKMKTSVAISEVDRSKGVPYPSEDSKLEFKFPKIEQTSLNNNARLVVISRKDLPIVEMQVMFDGGYAVETADSLGHVNFTMSMLDEGTSKYNVFGYEDLKSELGSSISFGSSLDTTYASLSSLKINLEPTLDLLLESLLNPTFPEEEIQRLKKIWTSNIEESLTTPASMAGRQVGPLLFGKEHPYGKPSGAGTTNSISNITREDIVDIHKELTDPSKATFILAGDIDIKEAKQLLNKKLRNWKSSSDSNNDIDLFNVKDQKKPRVFLIDKPEAIQSYILAVQLLPPTNSPDDIVIDYMNYAIAGSFTSRLNMNLREDKSWSYGVRTGIGSALGQRLMQVRAPVQTDKTVESIQEILKEYNGYLTSNQITQEELDKVKKARTLRMPGNYETVGSLLNAVSGIVKYERELDYLDTLAEKRNLINLTQVKNASTKYIDPQKWTWIIVGDLSKVEEGIRDLEIGQVKIIKAQ